MSRAYSESRVVFNRSIRDDLNMRVFESLACGSLLTTNHLPTESGQSELFRDGVHLATYRDPEELFDKLRFYLSHPETRAKVERAGRDEVTAKHTYRHRMERILAAAERLAHFTRASSPVPPSVDANPSLQAIPAADPGYYEFDRPELLALIPRDARDVVDVGCAAGLLGAALKGRQSCRVVGVEQNAAAAAAARSRLTWSSRVTRRHRLAVPAGLVRRGRLRDVPEHPQNPLSFLRRVRGWLLAGASSSPACRMSAITGHPRASGRRLDVRAAGLLDHTYPRFFTRRKSRSYSTRRLCGPCSRPSARSRHREWVAAGRPGKWPLEICGSARLDCRGRGVLHLPVAGRCPPGPSPDPG